MIIVSIRGNTELSAETMSRLVLILLMTMGYISLFVLLGIAVSSIVHRSSVSLLLLLSVWIVIVIVVPNVAGIVAESTLDVTPEREIAKQAGKTYMTLVDWRESVKSRGIKDREKLSQELARFMERDIVERMRLTDSYINSIHDKEDLALNISRISPASTFESACAEIVGSGVLAQRRFYRSARKYYDLYENYKREKTGMADKYLQFLNGRVEIDGETIVVAPPQPKPLPKDISDFPVIPKFQLSVGESVVSGLWSIVLLIIWNVILFMAANVAFLRYDVRQ
jgi:ABC-type transport system involved in multi-copper enzyme maturation permease subunit